MKRLNYHIHIDLQVNAILEGPKTEKCQNRLCYGPPPNDSVHGFPRFISSSLFLGTPTSFGTVTAFNRRKACQISS
jgi:hypothetical protein